MRERETFRGRDQPFDSHVVIAVEIIASRLWGSDRDITLSHHDAVVGCTLEVPFPLAPSGTKVPTFVASGEDELPVLRRFRC
jgi:hypothetical protein